MIGELSACAVTSTKSNKPPDILQVRLTPELLQRLTESKKEDISIAFDDASGLRIGETLHPFSILPESSINEVHRYEDSASQRKLQLAGRISHKLTMKRELAGSVSEKLKSRQAEEAAAKQERSVQAVELGRSATNRARPTMTTKNTPPIIRSDSPARRSPFLQPRKSPLLVASASKTSVPPLRTRLVQILATGAITEDELLPKLRAPRDQVTPLLSQVANVRGQEWFLKDEMFLDIRVWDWKGYTTAERTQVISRASEAMDRLELPPQHLSRARLIHPEKRNLKERSDTSPLSLNPPLNSNSAEPLISPEKMMEHVKQATDRPGSLKDDEIPETRDRSSTSERKVTAKGIMSLGKQTTTKKAKADSKQSTAEKANDQLVSRKAHTDSETTNWGPTPTSAATNELRSTSRNRDEPLGKEVSGAAQSTSASDRTIAPKAEKKVPQSDNDVQSSDHHQTGSQSTPTKVVLPPSQATPPKQTSAVDRSKQHDSSTTEEGLVVDRTSSITSTTTEASDRSLLSVVSSASTAPSSIEHPTQQKPRSKFLTIKKRGVVPSLSQPVSRPASPAVSTKPKSSTTDVTNSPRAHSAERNSLKVSSPALRTTGVTCEAETTSHAPNTTKKRKVNDGITPAASSKRLKADLEHQVVRDLHDLYPEYRKLHDQISSKVGDAELLAKFLEVHNKISTWKKTLANSDGA